MRHPFWRCRNRACPAPCGAVLGRLTTGGGVMLDPAVRHFRDYLDAGRESFA